jgi:hypothetical protein
MQIWCNYQDEKRIDFLIIPFYGAQRPSIFLLGSLLFRSETTWLRETQNDVNGPKQTFAN